MGGESKSQQQTQQQQSQFGAQTQDASSEPWGPSQPILQSILSGIQSQAGNYQANPTEQAALAQLTSNFQNLPNWSPQTNNLASSYFGGDPSGLLSPALRQFQDTLNPIASGSADPTQTPGIQNLLATIRGDVGNSVNGLFAGAGRDLSGLHTQTLARGITQGEAAPLLAQYNQNMQDKLNAAKGLYDASGNTASLMGANQAQGLNFAQAGAGTAAAGPMGVLAAQAAARGIPLENLGMLANLTIPIAGLGGTQHATASSSGYTTGTSNTQGTQQMSGAQQFATIAGGVGGLFGKLFPTGIWSDRRLKKDIEQVGELFDGTPVYRFRYNGDQTVHIGLMADEVVPEAVKEFGGYKYVDYELATNRSVEA